MTSTKIIGLISELTWDTCREWILEYKMVKYDGDLGNPNVFVYLNEGIVAK